MSQGWCQVLTRVLVMSGPPQCCSSPQLWQRGQHVTPPPAGHLLGPGLCSLSPRSTVTRSLHLSVRTLAPGVTSSERPEAQSLPCGSDYPAARTELGHKRSGCSARCGLPSRSGSAWEGGLGPTPAWAEFRWKLVGVREPAPCQVVREIRSP